MACSSPVGCARACCRARCLTWHVEEGPPRGQLQDRPAGTGLRQHQFALGWLAAPPPWARATAGGWPRQPPTVNIGITCPNCGQAATERALQDRNRGGGCRAHPAAMASPLCSSSLAPEEVLAASMPANTAEALGVLPSRAAVLSLEPSGAARGWFDIQVHLVPPTGPFLPRCVLALIRNQL